MATDNKSIFLVVGGIIVTFGVGFGYMLVAIVSISDDVTFKGS